MFTLTKGAAVKTVSTQAQCDNLVAMGWALQEGGTAGTAYDVHDFSNPTPQDFKGIGLGGEAPNTIAYAAKMATRGVDKEGYASLVDIIHEYGETVIPSSYTKVETVSVLPTSGQSATTVYLLTHKDATEKLAPGAYIYKNSKWTKFTV